VVGVALHRAPAAEPTREARLNRHDPDRKTRVVGELS
jgi:hypothetical protein